jgi:hypothetical protein
MMVIGICSFAGGILMEANTVVDEMTVALAPHAKSWAETELDQRVGALRVYDLVRIFKLTISFFSFAHSFA